MNFKPILFVIGILLLAEGMLMIAPGIIDYYMHDPSWFDFMISSILTLLCGGLLTLANRIYTKIEMSLRETFLMTSLVWLVLTSFASLPFLLTYMTTSTTDAVFEAISALTTTGATVITGLDYAPAGILLWRSLLQWFGGIGIIVMAMTVLPILRIGGMQLFRSEFSDTSEKILPRVSQITKSIFLMYLSLTVICIVLLFAAGMSFFDAICHGLTSISTGGMSTHDISIKYFNSPIIEAIIMVFMIIGSLSFLLIISFLKGDVWSLWRDSQTRTFLTIAIIAPIIVATWQAYNSETYSAREAIFNTVSVLTTTGFESGDFELWGSFPMLMFLSLMAIGGCTGSTAGGLKVFRIRIISTMAKVQLNKLYRPHGVIVPKYNRKIITPEILTSVYNIITLFIFAFAGLSLLLALTGLDFISAITGALSCMTSTGPAFGNTIGVGGNYAMLPDISKWLLMFGMLLGRLELLTILVLFTPGFWRD